MVKLAKMVKEYRPERIDNKLRLALSLFIGKVPVKSIIAIGFNPQSLDKILKQEKAENIEIYPCWGVVSEKASLAICLDTLEHISPRHILSTLREIRRLSTTCFFVIKTYPDETGTGLLKRTPHRTIRNRNWWRRQLRHVGYHMLTETDKEVTGELRLWAI